MLMTQLEYMQTEFDIKSEEVRGIESSRFGVVHVRSVCEDICVLISADVNERVRVRKWGIYACCRLRTNI